MTRCTSSTDTGDAEREGDEKEDDGADADRHDRDPFGDLAIRLKQLAGLWTILLAFVWGADRQAVSLRSSAHSP